MQNDVETIELNIQEAQKFLNAADKLERLLANKDFKEIVDEGFFKEESIRLVHLKGDPHMQAPEKQAAIIRDIDGIASFKNYLSGIFQKANMAEQAIKADEEELEHLRNNEEEGV